MMRKTGKVWLIGLTVLTMGVVTTTTTTQAEAASWHAGTPKALRGTWHRTYHNQGTKIGMHFKVSGKSIDLARKHHTESKWTNLKYRQIGKGTYLLVGTYKTGELKEKSSRLKIIQKKNQLKFKNAWSSKYEYLGWYQQS